VEKFLKIAADSQHEVYCNLTIEALAPRLSGKAVLKALEIVRDFPGGSQSYGARTVSVLIPRISIEDLPEAVDIVSKVREFWGVDALDQLHLRLDETAKLHTLNSIGDLVNDHRRAHALADALPFLEGGMLNQAIKVFLAIGFTEIGEWDWATHLWPKVVAYISPDQLEAAWTKAASVTSPYFRAKALRTLLPLANDSSRLLADIHRTINECFLSLSHESRGKLLEVIADKDLFAPPVFEPDLLERFADEIFEVCHEWQWL
jgi:hypothetical protein